MNFLKQKVFYLKTRVLEPSLYAQYLKNEKIIEDSTISTLNEYNLQKRIDLVQYAVANSAFYKKKYEDAGIDVANIKNDVDFSRLPVLTRKEIADNFSALKAKNIKDKDFYSISTSGSTGAPLTVLHDKRFSLAPVQWRLLKWWGLKPYENKAFIYRFPRGILKRILNYILWWPTERIFLAGTDFNTHKVDDFIKSIHKVKPTLIQGYIDVVYEFAIYIKKKNIKLKSIKAVWVTSGPIFKHQRALMEEVFNAPVYDQYGSTEIMMVSAECKYQNGLHIFNDLVKVECLDEYSNPVPPNTWGKLVLTDLTNYVFPIIRYDIGDYGRLLDVTCSCGLNLPLMDKIKGRNTYLIETPTGKKIEDDFLNVIFDDFPNTILSYQFIQNKDYSVELHFIKIDNAKNLAKVFEDVLKIFMEKTGHEIQLTFKERDKLIRINGKQPLVINRVYGENLI
ncbi:phenylacetate--CoA ligase family protein [Maribacter sp. LLG6340-A2]|uniref:phenylacetate--CoA ligase family protein n=1 Tax=Maribacter sp. LLG6340-A2 TaxID=3160834 RepID=UPI00386948D0